MFSVDTERWLILGVSPLSGWVLMCRGEPVIMRLLRSICRHLDEYHDIHLKEGEVESRGIRTLLLSDMSKSFRPF